MYFAGSGINEVPRGLCDDKMHFRRKLRKGGRIGAETTVASYCAQYSGAEPAFTRPPAYVLTLRAHDPLMTDIFSKRKRSWIMSRIQGTNTGPEKTVRSFLHRKGFRFKLHVTNLPGKPDIVLPARRTVVFVNGCFWHGHSRCNRATLPSTRRSFWRRKILGNTKRDRRVRRALRKAGWNTLTVWECQVRKPARLERALSRLLTQKSHYVP